MPMLQRMTGPITGEAIVAFVVLDLLWLGVIAKGFYQSQVGSLMASPPNFVAAGALYAPEAFGILQDATKPEIKAAVELMFKVEVKSVSTVTQKGKVKRFGRSIGRRDHVKKAYVSLKPGQELNFSGEAA